MGAFKVMSQCCVHSIYDQKYRKCDSRVEKIRIKLAEYWTLFKIRVYYTLLNLRLLL